MKELLQDLKNLAARGKPTSLWQDFKAFAFKGSMIDLAVAVVIGTAFTGVINALVKNVIMPLLSYISENEGGYRAWHIGRVEIGAFLGEFVNFLIIAFAVFLVVVKLLGSIKKAVQTATGAEPPNKQCAMCLSVIPFKARKCAFCTTETPG